MTSFIPYFRHLTLDDIMREVFEAISAHGTDGRATRGSFRELTGVVLHLDNPHARLSRTESRGRPFSALGEFCWYLSGCDDAASIEYYIPSYRDDADDGVLRGAYGPRIVGQRDGNQLEKIITLLVERATTRKAVIRLFDASDLRSSQRDVPCTCTLQFLLRDGSLQAITYMRSNDAFLGLPHDVFCFTLLQEWIACRLGVSVGAYKHIVGSLHLYDDDIARVRLFLNEGFQSTQSPMPSMPALDPDGSLRALLKAEVILRSSIVDKTEVDTLLAGVQPYWADLIRLLWVFRHFKDAQRLGQAPPNAIAELKSQMASRVYNSCIDRQVERLVGHSSDKSHE